MERVCNYLNRADREEWLKQSGLIDTVKSFFEGKNVDISDEYYMLIVDYIKSVDLMKDTLKVNPVDLAVKLPEVLNEIKEDPTLGAYGLTDNKVITMDPNLDYNSKRLYFFHELTHALRTVESNGHEECGFYNSDKDGLFLEEASTQYTAELLANLGNIQSREQRGTVRGQPMRIPNSPLSEYQYNGNVLNLLAKSMGKSVEELIALSYEPNARAKLKEMYEENNQNPEAMGFDELMKDMGYIYTIDKYLIAGHPLVNEATLIAENKEKFRGSRQIQGQLMNKIELQIANNFLYQDPDYVIKNYNEVLKSITTPELKNTFLKNLNHFINVYKNNEMPIKIGDHEIIMAGDGFMINEFGEIIRINAEQNRVTTPDMANFKYYFDDRKNNKVAEVPENKTFWQRFAEKVKNFYYKITAPSRPMLPEGKNKTPMLDKITRFLDSLEPDLNPPKGHRLIKDISLSSEQKRELEEWRAKQNKASTNEWIDSIKVDTSKLKPTTSLKQETNVIPKKDEQGYDYEK